MAFLSRARQSRIGRRYRLFEGLSAKVAPEVLEVRCTPAASVMNLTGTGVLSYQAASGDVNDLQVSVTGNLSQIVFEDTGAGVTIDATNVPGSVQLAPNRVGVPWSQAIGSLLVNLSDMSDRMSLGSDLAGLRISVYGGAGDDNIDLSPTSAQTVVLGEAGNDTIWGGSAGDFLLGGAGNDTIYGNAGNDSINGGEGDDLIDGGTGDDTLGELSASPYVLPEIYGLLVYTGLDQPADYVNQLVAFNRDNPSYVNVICNNDIDPELYYGTGLDFDMSGNLYMTIQTDTNFLFRVNKDTGLATQIGGSGLEQGYRVSDLSWDPVGNRMLATVDFRANVPGPAPKPRLAEVNLATGAVTFLSTLDIDDNQTVALSVDSQGNYYVLGLYTQRWYRVDRSTYAVTPLASLPFYPDNWQQGSTIDWSRNDVLYYAGFEQIDSTTFRNTFFTVDKATGALTTVGIMGLNVNPNGSTQYADIAIDPLSGQGYAEPGNDLIHGGDGNDTVHSGTGNDTVFGNAGNDHIEGGDGDDLIDGGGGNDKLCGQDGHDSIYGFSGEDTITGGAGNDLIDGGTGDDLISGGSGDDTIYGNDGIDSLFGGVGDDLIYGGNDADLIFGEAGNDTILGENGNDLIYGGEGDDQLYGGTLATANTIHMPRNRNLASDGNDTILGGDGTDRVDGGNGDNLLDAGDDGIRETVLAGPGNDMMYSHKYSTKHSFATHDRAALDGGFNHVLCRGYLVQPMIPLPVDDCGDFTAPAIEVGYYTGQWHLHGQQLIEYPRYERVPGNRKGFTPPFRQPVPAGPRNLIRAQGGNRIVAARRQRNA